MCEKRRHEKNGEDGLPVTLNLTHDLSCVSPPLFQLQGKKRKKKKNSMQIFPNKNIITSNPGNPPHMKQNIP